MAVNTREVYYEYVGSDGGVVYYTFDGLQCKSIREAEHTDAVGKLEKELRKLYPLKKYEYPKSVVWRLVFMFMDCAHVVWFVLQLWLGLVVLPFWMDRLRLVSQEHGWKHDEALCFLLVAVVNSVPGWFLVLISFWRLGVRESLLLLVSDVAPPEAEILLLEWKRNRSTFLDEFEGVRQFVWIRVIEKARIEGYSVNMDHASTQYLSDKDIELQKITGHLRDLLLSRPSVDVGENKHESEESAWQYDHSLWRYKDVWPEGLHSAILLLGDLLFSPLGCFARGMNCLILLTLTGILDWTHLDRLPWGFVSVHYWIFILFSWPPYRAIKKHCLGN